MASLEIQGKANKNSLHISITYPSIPNLTFNFELEINIYLQQLPVLTYTRIHHSQYATPKKLITINELEYSKMYKVQVKNKYSNKDWATKNFFVNTPANLDEQEQEEAEHYEWRRSKSQKEKVKKNDNAELCNSQLLLKMVGKTANIQNKEKIHKYILEGRNCRNVNEFINEKNDRLRDRQAVMDKKKLLVHGMLFFNDIYAQRQGHKYFKNDWFMGPFYSYDHNENQIKRQ